MTTENPGTDRSPHPAAAGFYHEHEPEESWLDALLHSRDVPACVVEVLNDGERPDYRFLRVSRAFEEATGLHDAVGRSMREMRPDHEPFWFDLYRRVTETGAAENFEHAARALDHTYRGHAFRIGTPEAWRVVVIFELAPQIAATQEFPLEKFSAMLAHELRSPLAPLANGLNILSLVATPDPRVQSTLAMMERQFRQLSGLIDGLLDLGRLASSNVELAHVQVELHHVISESIEACAASIHAREQDVSIESEGEGLVVRGDRGRLTQVFTNLLTNSIKYTPPGGHIHIGLKAIDGQAVIELQDDGVGITAENLSRIFELFNQAPEHRYKVDGGLGIGLALVRSIVRLHGGTITASSDGPGRGSRFTVTLPLRSA